MVMVPDDYKTFISTLDTEIKAGNIPMSRIDDAVMRILTAKFASGVFTQPYAVSGCQKKSGNSYSSCCSIVQRAPTCVRSVSSEPMEMRTIQRPSSCAGVR
jgi:beta-glucosidase-like glycosyl hydrolase